MNSLGVSPYVNWMYSDLVVSVGGFTSPACILSLSCEFSGLRMVKEGVEVSSDSNDEDDSDKKMERTVVKLFIIHAKSLQESSKGW